ncbi:hypothetical protein V8E54_012846 [Elaphomyces granulatus]
MLGTESVPLLKDKHGKHICPGLYRRPGFQMGLSRRGLPCVPGFVLTDYKSQSRTMGKVLLGLYGRRCNEDKCDIIGMYVELSRCQELDKTRLFQPLRAKDFLESRMHPDLIAGIEGLKKKSRQNNEGVRSKACRYGIGHPNRALGRPHLFWKTIFDRDLSRASPSIHLKDGSFRNGDFSGRISLVAVCCVHRVETTLSTQSAGTLANGVMVGQFVAEELGSFERV